LIHAKSIRLSVKASFFFAGNGGNTPGSCRIIGDHSTNVINHGKIKPVLLPLLQNDG